MTVAELIVTLQSYDPELPVVLSRGESAEGWEMQPRQVTEAAMFLQEGYVSRAYTFHRPLGNGVAPVSRAFDSVRPVLVIRT